MFKKLDARTKAFLEIRSQLELVDGVANPYPDYANFLDLIDVADIDVLRDDPSMSLLVDAYDKAREVNERYN